MDSSASRTRPLLQLMFALLALFNAWAGWQFYVATLELGAAHDQLAQIRGLGAEIADLRNVPIQVESELRSHEALAQLVESSAEACGIDDESIVQITPGEPQRVGDSAYLRQGTDVELRKIDLNAIVRFVLTAQQQLRGLTVSVVSLRLPPDERGADAEGELWNVQLTLTSQIYAPRIPAAP